MAVSVICNKTQCRVSSVLNRDVKQFGKNFMFDSNEETCWNSDQGASQWVVLEFPAPVRVSELRLQFQGGFSGKSCKLEGFLIIKIACHRTLVAFYLIPGPYQRYPWISTMLITFITIGPFLTYLLGYSKEGVLERIMDFYPEDNNSLQSFPVSQDAPVVQKLKIVFENSADFFGRIIVYSLDILGEQDL